MQFNFQDQPHQSLFKIHSFMQTTNRNYEGDYSSAKSTNVWVLACTATGILFMGIGSLTFIIIIIVVSGL